MIKSCNNCKNSVETPEKDRPVFMDEKEIYCSHMENKVINCYTMAKKRKEFKINKVDTIHFIRDKHKFRCDQWELNESN